MQRFVCLQPKDIRKENQKAFISSLSVPYENTVRNPMKQGIKLFARTKTDGWDTWGNEVECDINMEEYMKGGDCIEN